jgi:hypothetical protein
MLKSRFVACRCASQNETTEAPRTKQLISPERRHQKRASRSLGQRKREVNIGEGALGASCLPEMVIQSHLDATEGLAMPTTILAYVIAIVGLVLIVAGARDIYLLHNEETFEVTLSDYETPIRTIAGGLAMIGLAQALRLLLEINRRP